MRIVYIHQHFRTPALSGGTRSFEFARRLVARGHSVDMITASPTTGGEGNGWTVTDEAGIRVHWCRVRYSNELGFRARLTAFAQFAIRATRRAASLPQDLVLATSTPLTVAIPGAVSAWRNCVAMVFEVRDVWPEVPIALGVLRNPLARRAALALEAWAYQSSSALIALSPAMATSISSRFPGTDPVVIPNGSDRGFFEDVAPADVKAFRTERSWLGDRPLLVYAGTLGRANNVGYVVEMATRLQHVDPEIRALIVGAGKERDGLEDLARRSGVLGRNLFLEPPVPKADMPVLLAAADLALSVFAPVDVLSSNSPNKVFDAFAAGCPVAINNGGWLGDLLDESGAGVALPAADPRTGAEIVAERIRDVEWMSTARSACRQLARERFDRDLLFDRFEQVLLRAANTSPHGRTARAR